jgi:glycosyltransferase involved in cell wall biosynthesis
MSAEVLRKGAQAARASAGALLFDGEVRDREALKSQRKDVPIQGFDVFLAGFTKALFASSRFSPVYVTKEAAESFLPNAPPWLRDFAPQIRTVSANDPSELGELERLILLSVGPEMIQLAWLRARLHRPDWPVTAILHSLSPAPRIRYFFTSALLATLTDHDAFVCPSQAAKRALENVYLSVPEEIRGGRKLPFELPVIPCGVDSREHAAIDRGAARQALGLAPAATVFLYFGRLAADKCDFLPLLIAFSQLPADSGATLVLAGDDTQYRMAGALAGVAQELGCGDRVQVRADLSHAAKLELLAAADVFVSPTENAQESFPLTIAEAMAAGLPVVTSDWGAHGELVQQGETGFLVPTYLPPATEPWHLLTLYSGMSHENLLAMSTAVDVGELGRCLLLLLERPELRRAMGGRARRWAEDNLDWQTVIGRFDELWLELLERAKSGGKRREPFLCSSFHEVFAGYPTKALEGGDRVEICDSPGGRMARQLPGVLSSGRHFKAETSDRVLTLLAAQGATRLDALVELACDGSQLTATDVERHTGRLIKYGIVRLARI